MQTAASNSLVLTDFSSSKRFADMRKGISYRGFYQLIASGLLRGGSATQVLDELGNKLVCLAEHSYALRQMDTLHLVSQALVTSPLPTQYETVGRYYQALCIQRLGRGDVEQAAHLLERVAETASTKYRVRAMISLAADSFYSGDYQSALSLYCEAGRFASRDRAYDPYATIHTQKMVAFISSLDGRHGEALALLENLFPLATAMRPSQLYYDYLNSLAVELCAVGRLEEAKNVCETVIASPFAPAYPEWHETRQEIALRGRRASRSTVGFSHSVAGTVEGIGSDESSEAPGPPSVLAEFGADSTGVSQGTAEASNILRFPVRALAVGSSPVRISSDTAGPARVLIMSERNKTAGRDSNEAEAKKRYEDLDGRQLLLKIMELTAATDITDYELLEILKSIESILYRQKDPGKR